MLLLNAGMWNAATGYISSVFLETKTDDASLQHSFRPLLQCIPQHWHFPMRSNNLALTMVGELC